MAGSNFTTVFDIIDEESKQRVKATQAQLTSLWDKPSTISEVLVIFQETIRILKEHYSHYINQDLPPCVWGRHNQPWDQISRTYVLKIAKALGSLISFTGGIAFDIQAFRKTASVRDLPKDGAKAQEVLCYILAELRKLNISYATIQKAWVLGLKILTDHLVSEQSRREQMSGLSAKNTTEDLLSAEGRLISWKYDIQLQILKHGITAASDNVGSELRDGDLEDKMHKASVNKMGQLKSQHLCDALIRGSDIANQRESQIFLKVFLSTPSSRQSVSTHFVSQLHARVLRTDLSTVSILAIYMRLIATFRELDSSGIVLRRLAEPIQAYLRSYRKDTVSIVITSFLENARLPNGELRPTSWKDEFCAEIAAAMENESTKTFREYYEGGDLEDVNWMPEPIDAAEGHQADRNRDAIAHLVTIAPRETFVEALQQILAERLLRGSGLQFNNELRLLSLLKQRFEELPIQSCEIMVRDMLSSQSLNVEMQELLKQALADPEGQKSTDFSAFVLSKYYWPELDTVEFVAPDIIKQRMSEYEATFRKKKAKRKLEFLSGMGRSSVLLELEDRKWQGDVALHQAAVIHQFQGTHATRTTDELCSTLGMETQQVQQACEFWCSQNVLAPTNPQKDGEKRYAVLERLPTRSGAAMEDKELAATLTATPSATPPIKTPEDLLAENMSMYCTAIRDLLRRQGAMPTGRILTMLGKFLPGGFPFTEEELQQQLLEKMLSQKAVDFNRETSTWSAS